MEFGIWVFGIWVPLFTYQCEGTLIRELFPAIGSDLDQVNKNVRALPLPADLSIPPSDETPGRVDMLSPAVEDL